MSLGPYTSIGPLWRQALCLCPDELLGSTYVFYDIPATAPHAGYLPDLSL
ncbi:hypothetical protein M405DRAFT_939170 [Rhizopogon salebrosus TDB-379]|nr:hypothetical protein M405DRAFT_939170 [Rhizopogon salebrosus TDB-379]